MVEAFLFILLAVVVICIVVAWIFIPFRISEIRDILKNIDSRIEKLQSTQAKQKKDTNH